MTDVPTIPYGDVGEVKAFDYGTERQLAECEYFNTLKLDLDGEKEINTEKSFVSLLVTDFLQICSTFFIFSYFSP